MKDFLKDFLKYLPAQIAPVVIGIVSIPIITRLFSPGEYGNYVLVMVTVSFLGGLTTGWLADSIIRFFPVYEKKAKLGELYNTILIFSIVSIAVISLFFLGALFLIENKISANLASLMRLGVLVFVATVCFQIFQSFFRAKRQVTKYTSFSIWQSVAGLGIGIALVVFFHHGVDGLLWGEFLDVVTILPLMYLLGIGKDMSIRKGVSSSMAEEMAKYGFPLIIAFLTFFLLGSSDRYILGFFRGSQEVGIYSASYAISEGVLALLLGVFVVAAGPILMQIWEKQGVKASQEFLTKLTRYYLLICLPATVGLSVLAKPIINIFVAQQYYEGYRIIPLVVFGFFFNGVSYSFALPFSLIKKTYIYSIMAMIAALSNVGLNFLLIPKYGYMAAAVTTLISYSLYLFLTVVASRRFLVWKFPFKALAKIALASTTMGITTYFIGSILTSSILINLIVAIGTGGIVYFVTLFLLRGFYLGEIRMILNFKDSIIKLLWSKK